MSLNAALITLLATNTLLARGEAVWVCCRAEKLCLVQSPVRCSSHLYP